MISLSFAFAKRSYSVEILPVPAGISLPTITFSFRPFKESIFPSVAASVRTFVVSWKEAADINEDV